MPSVTLVGSNTRRRSSAALVGEIRVTSSRPRSTRGRSAGHKAVASSVGSLSPANCRRRRNATGPFLSRPSSSSRRKFALLVLASSGRDKLPRPRASSDSGRIGWCHPRQ